MSEKVTLVPADDVSVDSRICHYDELNEDAKEKFPDLTEGIDIPVDSSIADGLLECDLVKYTEYYEISVD